MKLLQRIPIFVILVIGAICVTDDAQAQTPTPVPETPTPSSTEGATDVEFDGSVETDSTTQTRTVAADGTIEIIEPLVEPRVPGEGSLPVPSDPDVFDPSCIEWEPFPAADEPQHTVSCLRRLVCGWERIDDVVSGERAGFETTGKYREYLDQAAQNVLTGPGDILDEAGITDIDSVNTLLIAQGLTDQPSDQHIPVLHWCAEYDEVSGVFDPVDISRSSIGWGSTFEDTYDIPGTLNRLYGELAVRLDLYAPEIGLVPPAERGFTFVQWPTWMFLDNPPSDEHLYTTNSIDTLRIDLRAVLLGVDWHFGDELVASCAAEDMLQFERGTHDPVDNLPACHHIFTQLARRDLTVTINFKIEQRIAGRLASLYPYPENEWTDFLGAPTVIDLQSTLPDYEVHPIVAVNVPPDLTRQEIIDNARAAGTLPTLDD